MILSLFWMFLGINSFSYGDEKIILQRDFKNSKGLLRAIPESQKVKRSVKEKIENKKEYGEFDDTKALKKYFETFDDKDPVKTIMMDIINKHEGPKNLSVDELKSIMARRDNLQVGTTSRAALMVFGNNNMMQLLGQMVSPLDLASMKEVCTDTRRPARLAEEYVHSISLYPERLEHISINKNYKFTPKIKMRLDKIFNDPQLSVKDKMNRWYDNHGYYVKDFPFTYMELWDYLKNYHPEYLKDFVSFPRGIFYDIVRGVPDLRTLLEIIHESTNKAGAIMNWYAYLHALKKEKISEAKINRILIHVINNSTNEMLSQLIIWDTSILDRLKSAMDDDSFFQKNLRKVTNISFNDKRIDHKFNDYHSYLSHPSICAQFAQFYKENEGLLLYFIENAKRDQREYINCLVHVVKRYGRQKYKVFDANIILSDINVFLDEFEKKPYLLNYTYFELKEKLYDKMTEIKDSFSSHRQFYDALLKEVSFYLQFIDYDLTTIWKFYKKIKSQHPLIDNRPDTIKNIYDPNIQKILKLIDISNPLGQYIYHSLINVKYDQLIINDSDTSAKEQAERILKDLDLSKQFDRYVYVMIMEKMENVFLH